MTQEKKHVLFICTRNACRSQMAEAVVNRDLAESWQAFSAGTAPGFPNPLTLKALAEIGIDHSQATSKHLNQFVDWKFDAVITLCGDADETCPVFLGGTRREHIGFDNPDAAAGTEEERMAVFRRVLGEIRVRIVERLKEIERGEAPALSFKLPG